MHTSKRIAISVSVALAGLFSATSPAQVNITANNQGVQIVQTSFDFGANAANQQANSTTGMLSFNLATFNAATNNNFASGYLNVVNGNGWAVENLPVNNNGLPVDSTAFNLGPTVVNGTALNNVNQQIVFSPTPLAAQPNTPAANFNVGTSTYDAQGQSNNPGNVAVQPAPPGAPVIPAIPFAAGGVNNAFFEPTVPNVQAADNQCGPAAVANGLAYLMTKGLNAGGPVYMNNPGRGAVPGTAFMTSFNGQSVTNIPVLPAVAPNAGPPNTLPLYVAPDPRNVLPAPLNQVPGFNGVFILTPNHAANPIPGPGGPDTAVINNANMATYQTSEGIDVPTNSLVAEVDIEANRFSYARSQFWYKDNENSQPNFIDVNQGTSPQQQLRATEQTLDFINAKAGVNISYQYNTKAGVTMSDPMVAGLNPTDASVANGATDKNVSFAFILQAVQNQQMVVLGRTGHATDIVAAGTILGQPWVVMQSDLQQTPDDPNDTSLGFAQGLEFSFLQPDPAMTGQYILPGVQGSPIVQDDIVVSIPEPASLGLVSLIGIAFTRRRRTNA